MSRPACLPVTPAERLELIWRQWLTELQAPQELVKSTLAAMDLLPDPVTGVGQPYPPERRAALLDAAAERLVQAGVDSVYPPGTPTGPLDRPGLNDIA